MPPTQPQAEEQPEPPCEFTTPCITTSSTTSNPRKLISHIFGRNKSVTKLFPAHVWLHYCRKHYQHARYRSASWAFTQCELLMDSLERMERWGGVESFQLVLRRREVERIEIENEIESKNGGRGGSRGGSAGEDADDESSSDTYTNATKIPEKEQQGPSPAQTENHSVSFPGLAEAGNRRE